MNEKNKLIDEIILLTIELNERIDRYKMNFNALAGLSQFKSRTKLKKKTIKELKQIKRRLERELNKTDGENYRIKRKLEKLIEVIEKSYMANKDRETEKDLWMAQTFISMIFRNGNAKKLEREIDELAERYKLDVMIYGL